MANVGRAAGASCRERDGGDFFSGFACDFQLSHSLALHAGIEYAVCVSCFRGGGGDRHAQHEEHKEENRVCRRK